MFFIKSVLLKAIGDLRLQDTFHRMYSNFNRLGVASYPKPKCDEL